MEARTYGTGLRRFLRFVYITGRHKQDLNMTDLTLYQHVCVNRGYERGAIEHGQSPDSLLAERIATAAILASAAIDVERARLYLDLIQISLSKNIP